MSVTAIKSGKKYRSRPIVFRTLGMNFNQKLFSFYKIFSYCCLLESHKATSEKKIKNVRVDEKELAYFTHRLHLPVFHSRFNELFCLLR